jgi:hypothetical protein
MHGDAANQLMEGALPRMSITLREPIMKKVKTWQEKDRRAATAEMVSVLVEEALDAREKKEAKK